MSEQVGQQQQAAPVSIFDLSPCVICRAIVPHAPRCSWMRPKATAIRSHEVRRGDIVITGFHKTVKVTSIEANSPQPGWLTLRYSNGAECRAPEHWIVQVERPSQCGNYACDFHVRELWADRHICAECWPLQLAEVSH